MSDSYSSSVFKGKEINILNGVNKIKVIPSSSMSSDISLTLPSDLGGSNNILSTNGSGVLSWLPSGDFIKNGVSSQIQATITYLDEKTITYPTAFLSTPNLVATTEGSSADFTDRYINSIISINSATSFTYGNYMKYNARSTIGGTSSTNYDLIISGNKYPLIVYLTSGTLNAAINLSVDGTGYWQSTNNIDSVSNTKPSVVTLTNLTNGVAYRGSSNTLKWAYNVVPILSNSWITSTVDATVGSGANPKAKLLSNGIPVIMALNTTNLYTYLSSNLEGTGSWTSNLALTSVLSFDFNYLSTNYPAIIYFNSSLGQLTIVTNSVDNMSGSWSTINFITSGTTITEISMCILSNGNPACSFYDSSTSSLRFAVSSTPDGSGTWNIYIIGTVSGLSPVTILNDGTPAIAYVNGGSLFMTKNANVDGGGLWSTYTINSNSITNVCSLITDINQLPSVVYDDGISLYYERSCLPDRFPANTSYNINWVAIAQ